MAATRCKCPSLWERPRPRLLLGEPRNGMVSFGCTFPKSMQSSRIDAAARKGHNPSAQQGDGLMDIQPIRTESDYRQALRALSAFFEAEPEPGSPQGDHFDVLLTLVEAYETRHVAVAHPDPIDAIKFRMEQAGLTPRDLEPAIGRSNRVYEVLNGKRSLTLSMIRKLHQGFGIPAASLIGISDRNAA